MFSLKVLIRKLKILVLTRLSTGGRFLLIGLLDSPTSKIDSVLSLGRECSQQRESAQQLQTEKPLSLLFP
jgi:hypothetical protein